MTAEEPAEEPKKKRVKPPKGFAELPEWWLEITPHGTLYPDEDEVRRHNASQEARMYKNLAAQSDWEQANKEKYSLGENGELIDKKTGKSEDNWIRANKGFRYLLVAIDVYSRYAWAYPIKSKKGGALTHNLPKNMKKRVGTVM